jgi:hypothetical protein
VCDEAVAQLDSLRELVLELYSASGCVGDSKGEHAVPEIDDVGRLEFSGVPNLEPFGEPIHHLLATPKRPAEAARLLAGIELELDVGRVADQHELEVPAIPRGPAGDESSAQRCPFLSRDRCTPVHRRRPTRQLASTHHFPKRRSSHE